MRDFGFWKSKANESTQCGQLKNAMLIVMGHLLDELGKRKGKTIIAAFFRERLWPDNLAPLVPQLPEGFHVIHGIRDVPGVT